MVTKKPKGLGRGLDALLGPSLSVGTAEGSAPATPAGTPMMLALHELAPGQYQPRTRMDEGALYDLADRNAMLEQQRNALAIDASAFRRIADADGLCCISSAYF